MGGCGNRPLASIQLNRAAPCRSHPLQVWGETSGSPSITKVGAPLLAERGAGRPLEAAHGRALDPRDCRLQYTWAEAEAEEEAEAAAEAAAEEEELLLGCI